MMSPSSIWARIKACWKRRTPWKSSIVPRLQSGMFGMYAFNNGQLLVYDLQGIGEQIS